MSGFYEAQTIRKFGMKNAQVPMGFGFDVLLGSVVWFPKVER